MDLSLFNLVKYNTYMFLVSDTEKKGRFSLLRQKFVSVKLYGYTYYYYILIFKYSFFFLSYNNKLHIELL